MTQNRINRSAVLQYLTTSTSSLVTCSTATPADDTIPQNTEGNEVLTLSITPTYSTSRLEIIFVAPFIKDANNGSAVVALFQDSTADALSALAQGVTNTLGGILVLRHYMTSGTTSATTFKIRVGPGANSLYINGSSAGARLLGGVSSTRLTIVEYLS